MALMEGKTVFITGAAGGITSAIFMGISVALVFKSKPK